MDDMEISNMAFSKTARDQKAIGVALFDAANVCFLKTAFIEIDYLKKVLAKYPPKSPIPPKHALRAAG